MSNRKGNKGRRAKQSQIVTLASAGVVVELFCEDEPVAIEGNASAIGPDEDEETNAWIRAQLDAGNDWAWCTAHVRVTYRGILVADTYLGCCSYKGEEDFKSGGYYDDMVSECLDEVNAKLSILREAV